MFDFDKVADAVKEADKQRNIALEAVAKCLNDILSTFGPITSVNDSDYTIQKFFAEDGKLFYDECCR